MNDMNSITLTGRLTRDAETKRTAGGMAILTFSVANNYSKKSGEEWVEAVNFFDVSLFGKQAEVLTQYMTKGKMIAIQGTIRQHRWEQDGDNRSKVGIIADYIRLLDGKSNHKSSDEHPSRQSSDSAPAPIPSQGTSQGTMDFDDDIPF